MTETTSPIQDSPVVRTGTVAWTGDNPFIYLKKDTAGQWSSLNLFFRIAASPYGTGRVALVVENPYEPSLTDSVRLVLTDNLEMAKYLVRDFVSKFVLFRPSEVMEDLEYIEGAEFDQILEGDDWEEKATTGDRSISLKWKSLGSPFAVDVPGPESGTGEHEMFAVFRIATGGEVTVDGCKLEGTTIERDFLNGPGQSAGMAISETWVEQ